MAVNIKFSRKIRGSNAPLHVYSLGQEAFIPLYKTTPRLMDVYNFPWEPHGTPRDSLRNSWFFPR